MLTSPLLLSLASLLPQSRLFQLDISEPVMLIATLASPSLLCNPFTSPVIPSGRRQYFLFVVTNPSWQRSRLNGGSSSRKVCGFVTVPDLARQGFSPLSQTC